MRSHTPALVLVLLLLGPLAGGLTASPPIGQAGFMYGQTDAVIPTDATTGELQLFKPTQVGDCRSLVASINAEATPTFTGVHLDRAGYWTIASSTGEETVLHVDPAPLRIIVTPHDSNRRDAFGDPAWDYDVQLAQGNTRVGDAYIDVYLENQFVRHVPTDADGRARIRSDHLPFAGTYELRAYKDLDEPQTAYLNAYTPPPASSCDPADPVDEPELYGDTIETTGAPNAVERVTASLILERIQPRALIRGDAADVSIQATTPQGGPVHANLVELVHDGVPRAPGDLGLTLTTEDGSIHLGGTWAFDGGLQLRAVHDANDDGRPEYQGDLDVFVHPPRPIRMVALDGSTEIPFTVPPRDAATGRAGSTVLEFRLLDRDGAQGRPPQITAEDFTFTGDLLTNPGVEYDAAGEHWRIHATPTKSNGTYHLVLDWPDLGTVDFGLHVPPEAGARIMQLPPLESLVAGQPGHVQVVVERVNDDPSRQACIDAGGTTRECQYSPVPDAHVSLFWADTGEALTWISPNGEEHAVEYRPGQQQGCDCVAFNGRYVFRDLQLERSGSLVAYAVVDANAGSGRYAYHELTVAPLPVLVPVAAPSIALAGEHTRYQIRVPNSDYGASTMDAYETLIRDTQGMDVTRLGAFSTQGDAVYWNSALPAGSYQVLVKDRLDPATDLAGARGTSTPADLTVVPAEIRFKYTTEALRPETTPYTLSQPQSQSYLLGGGLGDAVLLRIDVVGPTSSSPVGWITLNGTHSDGEVFAAFAQADESATPFLQDETVYAPGQPTWICSEAGGPESQCSATYTVHTPSQTDFYGRLRFFYDGDPVHVYARGLGQGNTTASFESARNSQSTPSDAHGSLHVVPPSIDITSTSTPRGQSRSPELALGLDNLVTIQAWDPTGRHDLDGVYVGLVRDLFGPGQRPGALLQQAADEEPWRATVGVHPDATGLLRVVVSKEASILDTGIALPVLAAGAVEYDGSSIHSFVEVPARVESGQSFQVRVATESDATPSGIVVRVFDDEYHLIRGLVNLQAPVVEVASDYELTVFLPDQEPRSFLVHIEPPASNPEPEPSSPPSTPGALVFTGLPASVRPNQEVLVRVLNQSGVPVEGATVQAAGGPGVPTDASGGATITVPAEASGVLHITAAKPGYITTETSLEIASTDPRLVLAGPLILEPFQEAKYRVTSMTGTVVEDARLSIETTWISLLPEDEAWTGTYKAPALQEPTSVLAVARAPGYEEARLVITIQGVAP